SPANAVTVPTGKLSWAINGQSHPMAVHTRWSPHRDQGFDPGMFALFLSTAPQRRTRSDS
ncbi:MAG: hypothetical protein M3Z49_12685, partial [Bifidobacteriales bacterium]|nr:hypothetical protein [Bifidobacteriales bacterium]